MRDAEMQLEAVKLKAEGKEKFGKLLIKMEKLRHKHILEEIEALKKTKVEVFSRDSINIRKKREINEEK